MRDGETIRRSSEIVKSYADEGVRVVVVVSAISGVTDGILEALDDAEKGGKERVERFIEDLRLKHLEACKDAVRDPKLRGEISRKLCEEVDELRKLLSVVAYLKEVTPRVRDYALSFGERLSTRIFWGALIDQGLKAEYLRGLSLIHI